MPAEREHQTLGDFLAIAVSPVLIMALVGSLVFFLVEVLYVGKYESRLLWILFCFVFAAVLIARISMQGDIGSRAGLYGLALAVVTLLGLMKFVDYPPESPLGGYGFLVNLGLMAIIWWSAHRLTWDCTQIDDSVEASGAGVLQAAGLDRQSAANGEGTPDPHPEDRGGEPRKTKEKKASTGLLGWWERYERYREAQRRRPHTPGVWVVYFSLAALPLFGLGQSLIPAADEERRQYVFWLMGSYVASGLGLMLSTCFLGLHRYLRQRKLQMPAAVTSVWVGTGVTLILLLLALGAFLPRPHPEYPLANLNRLAGSADRSASRYAAGGGEPGKGEGQGGSAGKGQREASSQGDKGSGQKEQGSGSGQDKSGSSGGQKSSGSQGSQGNQGGKQASGQNSSGDKSGQQGNSQDQKNQPGDKTGERSSSNQSARDSGSSWFSSMLGKLLPVLKWIVIVVVAVVIGFYVFMIVLRFLAHFTTWARNLLESLRALWERVFGGWQFGRQSAAEVTAAPSQPPRAFSSYGNPFTDGTAARSSPEELVRYSFEALEALAREQSLGRRPNETPFEFADRLGQEIPGLETAACKLAAHYARAAYARGRLPRSCLDALREFWERLETLAAAPLSA